MYPYKLASYQKKALCSPVTLWELDFNSPSTEEVSAAPQQQQQQQVSQRVEQTGSCDAVAVWVDYDLGDGLYLSAWDGRDFPVYLTVSVKFFPTPSTVQIGDTLQCGIRLDLDKCDFDYGFDVHRA